MHKRIVLTIFIVTFTALALVAVNRDSRQRKSPLQEDFEVWLSHLEQLSTSQALTATEGPRITLLVQGPQTAANPANGEVSFAYDGDKLHSDRLFRLLQLLKAGNVFSLHTDIAPDTAQENYITVRVQGHQKEFHSTFLQQDMESNPAVRSLLTLSEVYAAEWNNQGKTPLSENLNRL